MQAAVLPITESRDLQLVLDLARRLQIPFRIREVEPAEPEDLETITIRERLTDKYVKTGEWENMDEEQREDAAFVEMMLYSKEDPDNAYYSEEESNAILADLKNEHHATHH